MIYLIILCTLSIALNALFIWYIRKMLTKLLFVSDNMGGLLEKLGDFGDHLHSVHEMETFYGDPTLGNLIMHSKEILEVVEGYKDIYSLTREDLEEVDQEEQE